jgi:hypothetical protein
MLNQRRSMQPFVVLWQTKFTLKTAFTMKNYCIFAKSNLVKTKLVSEKRVGWGASPSGFFICIFSICDNINSILIFIFIMVK